MATPAALYTDEDMSALVTTLLRARGLDVTTVPEQMALGKKGKEQLEIAIALERCLVTHNRPDFERLNLQYLTDERPHFGIIVVPQKSAYELAQRIGILVNAMTANELKNQLWYA